MTDDNTENDAARSKPQNLDRLESTTDTTTPQNVVNSLVDRKGIEQVRENFEALTAPTAIMGLETDRDDVEIRELDERE